MSEPDHSGPGPRGRRLAEAVTPGWLGEVVRAQPAQVPWQDMARAAVAICAPLGAGLAAGLPQLGLLLAVGGLLGSMVDRGGPYRVRFRRIGCAALFGGAPGLAIGALIHGRGWLAVAALVLVAGVSALISALGDIASVTGLQLLVYSAFGAGPLGAVRPWWTVPLLFVCGVAWAAALLVPGWLLFPYTGQERRVAAVYHALAGKLAAIGTAGYPQARRAVTAALNAAYDEVLTARSRSGGRVLRLTRLVALLNQALLTAEAGTALALAGDRPPPAMVEAVEGLAHAIAGQGPPPAIPAPPGAAAAGMLTLHEGLVGAVDLLSGRREVTGGPATGAPRRLDRARRDLAALIDQIRGGRLTRMFTLRLMTSVGAAAVVSEVLPLQRSYWVVLTVAIVLKPDFGSVFARAVQRGIGTVIGAVIGALLLAVVPAGPLLLIPLAACAALLPYGRARNYGLLAVFLTPAVVLLIDLLARQGWQLAEARLIDTLAGCAIVLAIGYGPWPGHWHADLPRNFADAVDRVARYTCQALAPDRAAEPDGAQPGGAAQLPAAAQSGGAAQIPAAAEPGGAAQIPGAARPDRARLRRQAYRGLSDLRLNFQRMMAEPAATRRVAAAWWPAVVALEQAMDAVSALAVAADRGGPLPPAGAVSDLAAALRQVADAVRSGRPPPGSPGLALTGPLAPVAEAVRSVHDALAPQRAA